MALKYNSGVNFPKYYNVSVTAPIDSRFVVEYYNDLITGVIKSLYTGLLVYVIEKEEFYVFTATTAFTKNAKNPDYWKKIGGKEISENECEVVLNGVPESGNGIGINETGESIRDYISSESTISSDGFYTSQGLNTFEDDDTIGEEYIKLSNGGESYIKFYNGVDGKWIEMNLVDGDDSLGFTIDDVKVKDENGSIVSYVNGTQLDNGTEISFGKDIDFTGFTEERIDGSTHVFGEDGSSYEDVDIYTEKPILDVIVYSNGKAINVLTENDKIDIEEKISEVNNKIDNIYNTLMIDPDGDGSESPSTLQDVIINMNKAITKLEEIDIDYADNNDIDNMDSSDEEVDNAVIQVKTLKYFRDKLLFKVEDNKPYVEIDDEKKELATKEYVDSVLTWRSDLE